MLLRSLAVITLVRRAGLAVEAQALRVVPALAVDAGKVRLIVQAHIAELGLPLRPEYGPVCMYACVCVCVCVSGGRGGGGKE